MSVTQSSSTEGCSYRRRYMFSWSVILVDQECQTSFDQLQNHCPLCSVQDKQEGQISPAQMVNQESQTCSDELKSRDIQVSSIHMVNQESQTSLVLQANQESQTFQQEYQSRQETIEQENIKSQATSTKYENTENKSKESCDLDEPGILAILLHTIFRRCLECQYDLLDHLQKNCCLTVEAASNLKQEHRTERKRNSELIDLINPSNVEQFKEGLEASNQSHLVNFINKNGAREPPEDDVWPVSDSDIAPIIKSYPELVRDLYNKSLIDYLLQNKCLSSEQRNSIFSKDTAEEKNRELLSIMMRRSVRQLNIFFDFIEKDHAGILSQSKDKELFAVDFDCASEYRDANAEDVADKRQKILNRAEDPALEFNARLVEDRLYIVTKSKVHDGTRDGCSGPDLQSNNAVDGMKQVLNEVLGDGAGNIVITPVHKEEKTTDSNDPEFSSESTIMINEPSWRTSGITIVDGKIYMVGHHQSLIKVYDSHSLKPSRDISIASMKAPKDLAGCSYNKVLYISDFMFLSIYRVDLTNNSVTDWKMKERREPQGLSVTAEHTLLVTVQISDNNGNSGVVEYTSEGKLLREIRFDKSIRGAFHTVQLSNKQLVVSQADFLDRQHSVSLITTKGQIIKCYGKENGKGKGQLKDPSSLAIDYKCKHIFVVDGSNHRVLVLDFDLTYLDQVPISRGLEVITRLYFDSATERIFVSYFSQVAISIYVGSWDWFSGFWIRTV